MQKHVRASSEKSKWRVNCALVQGKVQSGVPLLTDSNERREKQRMRHGFFCVTFRYSALIGVWAQKPQQYEVLQFYDALFLSRKQTGEKKTTFSCVTFLGLWAGTVSSSGLVTFFFLFILMFQFVCFCQRLPKITIDCQ